MCFCVPLLLLCYADELKKRDYYGLVKQQVEQMYEQSEGKRVTLVAHSMGGPVSLYFLDTENGIVTQDWKDKHLHAYVTLSGAWGGSPLTVREIISGYSLGLPSIIGKILEPIFRPISRTQESGVWLFPDPYVFKSTKIVTTPKKNYTANDYESLFDDIEYKLGYSMYEGTEKINKSFPGPKVRTHCYWGLGTQTPLTYHYDTEFPVDAGHNPSKTDYSDGDGRVNNITSVVCLKWADTVENKTFHGVKHGDMIKSYSVFDAIAKVVTNLTAESKFQPKPLDESDKHEGGMFTDKMYRHFPTYRAIKNMIRKMVQMMVRI